LVYHHQPTPAFAICTAADLESGSWADFPPLPVVVKPAREGSTIGISLVRKEEELQAALEEALRHDNLALVEQFIAGREVTVGVLDGEALPIIEVVPEHGFYDYQAKYTAGCTKYLLPAPLEEKLYADLQRAAVDVFHLLGCSGAARIDFMIRDKEYFCLEANTIPGMTETSLLPKAAAAAGISFDQLVERILAGAGINK
jgi:D-alanine-D-alanine ligase